MKTNTSLKKDAYLILAHSNELQLIKLIHTLDCEYNDLYLHLDAKWRSVNVNNLRKSVSKSNIFIVNRIKTYWGGFSLVKAEIELLQASAPKHYRYYHIMSGLDFPVKNIYYIYNYFNEKDSQYIQYIEKDSRWLKLCYQQFHLFQDYFIGKKRNIFKYIDFLSCYIQRFLGVKRLKNIDVKSAWQWMSITDSLVQYLVDRKRQLLYQWRYTYCPDELFIPTAIQGTLFETQVSPLGSLRYIEWENITKHDRSPKLLTLEDFPKLKDKDILFARKISTPASDELIKYIETTEL